VIIRTGLTRSTDLLLGVIGPEGGNIGRKNRQDSPSTDHDQITNQHHTVHLKIKKTNIILRERGRLVLEDQSRVGNCVRVVRTSHSTHLFVQCTVPASAPGGYSFLFVSLLSTNMQRPGPALSSSLYYSAIVDYQHAHNLRFSIYPHQTRYLCQLQ
jgi:hypothetical protein